MVKRADEAVFSYAGRTASPVAQPLPTRIGGFGGVEGLCDYLRTGHFTHVIDATHPFAAGMSRNAITACAQSNVPLLGFERPPWAAQPDDDWRNVPDMQGAVDALPDTASRVFLAIGKQNLHQFAANPQHHYLLRLVDAPDAKLPLPDTSVVLARGPFDVDTDRALLRDHRIDVIVAKNAGGTGASAKMQAARDLGLPVILIDRPALPARQVVSDLGQVLHWIDHTARLGV